jgi:5-methylcytosine-specific restriction endonuclease McrA
MAKKKRGPITDPIVFAKLVLRGASLRWYARNQALVNQRVDRGVYRCGICNSHFKKQDLQADHTKPVVDVKKGDEGLEEWVRRLFTPVENWNWLCKTCHDSKTALENEMRKHYKKKAKK